MPAGDEPPPRPSGWHVPVFGLVAIELGILALIMLDGRHPSAYWRHHPQLGPWQYPTSVVMFSAAVVALEAFVLIAVLRARGAASLAGRAIVLGVGTFLAMFGFAIIAMHADDALGDLFLWHLAASAWLVAYGLGKLVVDRLRS